MRFAVDVGDSRVRGAGGDRGRGVVAALASRWGVIRNGESCVWFELDI